jgi:hypothetical protein
MDEDCKVDIPKDEKIIFLDKCERVEPLHEYYNVKIKATRGSENRQSKCTLSYQVKRNSILFGHNTIVDGESVFYVHAEMNEFPTSEVACRILDVLRIYDNSSRQQHSS